MPKIIVLKGAFRKPEVIKDTVEVDRQKLIDLCAILAEIWSDKNSDYNSKDFDTMEGIFAFNLAGALEKIGMLGEISNNEIWDKTREHIKECYRDEYEMPKF